MNTSIMESSVLVRGEIPLPLDCGRTPSLITFTRFERGEEHFVLRFGKPSAREAPLVRIHSECITGDLLRSQRCDCGAQLEQAMDMAAARGGYIVYLRQEGRGIGLYAKVDAYGLQDRGMDTFAANEHLALPRDARDYICAAQMLIALGVKRLRLITNNPDKVRQLVNNGLDVVETISTGTFLTPHNQRYLHAKALLANHDLDVVDAPRCPVAAACPEDATAPGLGCQIGRCHP